MHADDATLLLVDLQNDFCPGGHLAVPGGDEVIPLANQLQKLFSHVIATQDWHPGNHSSFASNHAGSCIGDVINLNGISQILWPDHCVQGTHGAAFHPALQQDVIEKIFFKGVDANVDSYSAFFDNEHVRATGLADYLRERHLSTIYIMGLATDYCVKYSVMDALQSGFNVFVIIDACRGVELHAGDVDAAVNEMRVAGANIVKVADVIAGAKANR